MAVTILEQAVISSQRLAPNTQERYVQRIREFIDYAGPSPHDWTPVSVEGWRNYLATTGGRHGSGRTPETVNSYLAAIKFASKRCGQLGYCEDFAKAAERQRMAPMKSERGRALTLDQCRALLAECSGNGPYDLRDRAIILVELHAAFRRTATVTLEFESIERMQGAARLTAFEKGQKYHTVVIDGDAWAALRTWMSWLKKHGISSGPLFRGLRWSLDGWIIGDNAMNPDTYYKMLKKRGEACDIEGLHPHLLRHTYTSLALQADVPEWKVRKVLGHKTNVMIDRYSHLDESEAIGAALPSFEGDD